VRISVVNNSFNLFLKYHYVKNGVDTRLGTVAETSFTAFNKGLNRINVLVFPALGFLGVDDRLHLRGYGASMIATLELSHKRNNFEFHKPG
jgi:hypothetical protein